MRLTQLQGEVNLRRDQFNRLTARATDLRQEGAVADTGMSPLGYAVAPSKPTFPNKPLILGGATGLGFAFGILLALLLELFGRKVRGVEDLQNGFDIPLLAVVRPARSPTSPSRGWLGLIALPNLGRLGRA
jgi:polysaccharide biosynthesis transport protein